FFHEKNSVAYVGDIVIRQAGQCRHPNFVVNGKIYLKSLLRLSGLDLKTLLMAHGGPLRLEENNNVIFSVMSNFEKREKRHFNLLTSMAMKLSKKSREYAKSSH
ncbi:MAG: hypothetical protein HQK54_11660, partial [Oligoflexales bacterium]|nr:hypothetical protein [Oligoflexales bacterium]